MSFVRFAASAGCIPLLGAVAMKMVVLPGLTAAMLAAGVSQTEAKTPGKTYCFHKKCHRVKTIAETEALIGRDLTVFASHYDSCHRDRFNPCGLTSSGERFAADRADNAASPVLPDGTIVLVWSKASQEAVVLRINNAGPYWGNRTLDLSRAAARKLGIGGVGAVTLRVIKAPTPAEARYSKNRRYEPVPGPIGQFASLDAAQTAMTVMVAQARPNTTALAGLFAPAASDPAIDLASAFRSPVVPGFAMPKGALADALIAQTRLEQRVVTAVDTMSPSIAATSQASVDVKLVSPKLIETRAVAPKRQRVKAVEVKPAILSDPITALVTAVAALVEPAEAPKKPVKNRSAPGKVAAAKPKLPVAVKKQAPAHVVRLPRSEEFRAGFTTYAEDRYRKPVKTAAVNKSKAKTVPSKASGGANAVAGTAPAGASKQVQVNRGRKSAALKKSGGWDSSAVVDQPLSPPVVLPGPRMPASDLIDESDRPNRPRIRVHPSALV